MNTIILHKISMDTIILHKISMDTNIFLQLLFMNANIFLH